MTHEERLTHRTLKHLESWCDQINRGLPYYDSFHGQSEDLIDSSFDAGYKLNLTRKDILKALYKGVLKARLNNLFEHGVNSRTFRVNKTVIDLFNDMLKISVL